MNTKAFTKSAAYYDVLYRKKNYNGETKRINSIIRCAKVPSKEIVDLGCGTGEHAIRFAKLGYKVTGIDTSADMLRVAKNKARITNLSIVFKKSDITSFRSNHTFDIALSLFHVASYLLTDVQINRFFSTTYDNLKHGGLFIFDCWYGPGVIKNPPEIQTKMGRGHDFTYTRTKRPVCDKKSHLVQVTHDTHIAYRGGKTLHYKEIHHLRYFFEGEIKRMLKKAGFSLLCWGDVNNNFAPPKSKDWNVLFVAQKPTIIQGKEK